MGPRVYFVDAVWQYCAMIIAIRQALDYTSTMMAVGVDAGWAAPGLPVGLEAGARAGGVECLW